MSVLGRGFNVRRCQNPGIARKGGWGPSPKEIEGKMSFHSPKKLFWVPQSEAVAHSTR